jgi:hypothetical protein
MPRGRKKAQDTTDQQVAPETTVHPTEANSLKVPEHSEARTTFTRLGERHAFGSRLTGQGIQETPASEPTTTVQRERFRTWVTDTARGYTRKTDNEYNRLVLQFEQRPSGDVITALKGAGFHFQSDYCGEKNAWVRRNDHEGRHQVEAIERLFRSLSSAPELPVR